MFELTTSGQFTRKAERAHEMWARGHEAWEMEGRASHPLLAHLFRKQAGVLRSVYGDLDGLEAYAGFKIRLTDRMREVYAHLYTPPEELD